MILNITDEQVNIILTALEERKSTLATRTALFPSCYPPVGKAKAELKALDDVYNKILGQVISRIIK